MSTTIHYIGQKMLNCIIFTGIYKKHQVQSFIALNLGQ